MTDDEHPLERVRLDHYQSYRDLSIDIKKLTGLSRDPDCWRRVCQGETAPSGTTKHGMLRYLALIKARRAIKARNRATGRKRRVA
jgi:hypothetical protein